MTPAGFPRSQLRPAEDGWHQDFGPRGIPLLTLEPLLPQRVVSAETVRSVPYRHTIYVKPYLAANDFSSNANVAHAYLATQVWSPSDTEIRVLAPHKMPYGVEQNLFKINGEPVIEGASQLRRGWNSLVLTLAGAYHLAEFVVCVDGPPGLRFCAAGDAGGSPWAVVGPFAIPVEMLSMIRDTIFGDTAVIAEPYDATATAERGAAFWEASDTPSVANAPYFQPVASEHLPETDVFLQAYTDKVTDSAVRIDEQDGLLSGADWTTIHPTTDGGDVRVLLDFGREVVGFHAFDVDAPAGTVLDWHNFEFIQPDGRFNFAEGMNNSFRFVCREGRQAYQSFVRRGFRYSYLILRDLSGPVRLRNVRLIFNTYPQTRRGSFVCSDAAPGSDLAGRRTYVALQRRRHLRGHPGLRTDELGRRRQERGTGGLGDQRRSAPLVPLPRTVRAEPRSLASGRVARAQRLAERHPRLDLPVDAFLPRVSAVHRRLTQGRAASWPTSSAMSAGSRRT